MATYIIMELVEKNATEYLDNLNFHIIPCANPDGYEYTMMNGGDRLWRKNRSRYPDSTPECLGVDLNRNWGFKFNGLIVILFIF
jgi:murein tripeptide amidase MpaA